MVPVRLSLTFGSKRNYLIESAQQDDNKEGMDCLLRGGNHKTHFDLIDGARSRKTVMVEFNLQHSLNTTIACTCLLSL
jgi:hypothetical protein